MNQDHCRTTRNVARSLISASLALSAMLPAIARAQEHEHGAGNGFLFGKPDGTFTLRGGYSRANATGDIYNVQRRDFTFGPRGFDALSLGADLGLSAGRRFDVGVSFDGTVRSHGSEYRAWLDNNDQPIKQTTNLSTFGISANLKYNFRDRGRSISRFAWIPSQYVPYVGIGAGMLSYTFRQKGDFIDFQTNDVYTDALSSTAWSGMGQIFSGVSYSIGPRFALISEGRYTLSTAKMTEDYSDFDRINLSGLSLNVGTAIRF
jgi:opacity protein-like surface antigen